MIRSSQISGTVEATHSKAIANGKTRFGVCIKDTWYNLLSRQVRPDVATGRCVEFEATNKGGKVGWCIHPGTLHVVSAAPPAASPSETVDWCDEFPEAWSEHE